MAAGENKDLWPYQERKSAGESAPMAASNPLIPGKYVLFSRGSQSPANSRDYVAVRVVWTKPLSGTGFRYFQGKYRENLPKWAAGSA